MNHEGATADEAKSASGQATSVVARTTAIPPATFASRLLPSLSFGVSALDARVYAGVALLLASSATIADYVPARRATRIDPNPALRTD